MNSFSPGPDGERGVNLPEQANALVELGLRTDLRISPHKRPSIPRYATSELLEPGRLIVTDRSSVSDSAIWRSLNSGDWFKSQDCRSSRQPDTGASTLGPGRLTPDLLFTLLRDTQQAPVQNKRTPDDTLQLTVKRGSKYVY
jgi:hypothetical protein